MLKYVPKIVVFDGGLGNQLFQLNYCLYLRNRDFNVIIDISKFDNHKIHEGALIESILDLDFKVVSLYYRRSTLGLTLRSVDRFLGFMSFRRIFEIGYFQKLSYFDGSDFKNYFWSNYLLEKKAVSNKSLGVHFRRGDFSHDNNHVLLDTKYYKKGIKHIGASSVVIYTDDIECARRELINSESFRLGTDSNSNALIDFNNLMSHEYLLIANSSFSWMAAYLGDNKTVIAPKQWYYSLDDQDDAPRPHDWIYL